MWEAARVLIFRRSIINKCGPGFNFLGRRASGMLCVKGKLALIVSPKSWRGEMNGLIASASPPPRPYKDSPIYVGIRLISQIISNNFYSPPGGFGCVECTTIRRGWNNAFRPTGPKQQKNPRKVSLSLRRGDGKRTETKGPDVTKSSSEEAESVAHQSRRSCSRMRSMPLWNKHIELSGGAAQVFWPCAGLTSKYLRRPTFRDTDCPRRHFYFFISTWQTNQKQPGP